MSIEVTLLATWLCGWLVGVVGVFILGWFVAHRRIDQGQKEIITREIVQQMILDQQNNERTGN